MSGHDVDLVAHQDGSFSEQYRLFGVIPLKNDLLDQISIKPFMFEGNPCFTVSLFGIPTATYSKVKPVPVPENWIKATGTYLLPIPIPLSSGNRADLVYDKGTGFYLFKVAMYDAGSGTIEYPLEILNDHEAVLMGYGRHLGETVQLESNSSNDILYYSGIGFKKSNGHLIQYNMLLWH